MATAIRLWPEGEVGHHVSCCCTVQRFPCQARDVAGSGHVLPGWAGCSTSFSLPLPPTRPSLLAPLADGSGPTVLCLYISCAFVGHVCACLLSWIVSHGEVLVVRKQAWIVGSGRTQSPWPYRSLHSDRATDPEPSPPPYDFLAVVLARMARSRPLALP